MATPCDPRADLGFVEAAEQWKLKSHLFPSKIGGIPAWLALKNVPKSDDLLCGVCGKVCIFLLQVYAPIEADDNCFHRTIYVFICKDPKCSKLNSNKNFVVFRSQLKRENEYYSTEPPNDEACSTGPTAADYGGVCAVCGCRGPSRCAKCHQISYCCKDHQTIDWKAGHKVTCGNHNKSSTKSLLFPELELITEPEVITQEEEEKSEEAKLSEFQEFISSKEQSSDLQDASTDKDLEAMASAIKDRAFDRFRKKIDSEPEQVLRYSMNGTALWVSDEHKPSDNDIPNCSCGGPRTYEFQVMPQLLQHLAVDSTGESIDWGTLAVYTCSRNCSSSHTYIREFLWKQDYSASDST